MKTTIITLSFLLLLGLVKAQDSIPTNPNDTTKIVFGKSEVLIIKKPTGYRYNMGRDSITGEVITWTDTNSHNKTINLNDTNNNGRGIGLYVDLGTNGYLTPTNSINLPKEYDLLELNYAKSHSISWNITFTVPEIIKKRRLYIQPGIGIDARTYSFKNNIGLGIGNDTLNYTLDTINDFSKNKLKATYVQVPLLLGMTLGKKDKTEFSIQFGVIGSYLLRSRFKQKYQSSEAKVKNKIRDDFNLSPFRADLTARIGLKNFGFFLNYGLTPLFEKDKTTELIPFTVGLTVGGF